MQIAVLLFDRFTALDAVGPYEVLSRLPGAQATFVGVRRGPVATDTGRLSLIADAALDEVPAPDIALVPGGPGQAALMGDGPVRDWLRSIRPTWTTSVCTGSLLLAAAGLLAGRRATTHWAVLDDLSAYGAQPVAERVVTDGPYVTAAGVSAGIDMALTLAGRIAGDLVAQAIQLGIEYDPRPPYRAGGPATAPPALVDAVRGQLLAAAG